jgi:hypothetical protein
MAVGTDVGVLVEVTAGVLVATRMGVPVGMTVGVLVDAELDGVGDTGVGVLVGPEGGAGYDTDAPSVVLRYSTGMARRAEPRGRGYEPAPGYWPSAEVLACRLTITDTPAMAPTTRDTNRDLAVTLPPVLRPRGAAHHRPTASRDGHV